MFWLPTGFDRGDGSNIPSQPASSGGGNQPFGTPIPDGAMQTWSNAGNVASQEEEKESPEIERAEQATFQHRFKMSWAACLNYIVVLGRGLFLQDSGGNLWRLLSSKIQSIGSNMGQLSIVAESISFDTPPDDYQMTPVELGVDIIKHPRYFYALYPQGTDFTDLVGTAPNQATRAQVKMAIIRAVQTYRDSPYFPQLGQFNVNGVLQNGIVNFFVAQRIPVSSGVPDATGSTYQSSIDVIGDPDSQLAIAAAGEIIRKLWYQIDTPYVAGFQIQWTQYFFAPVYENPGGYIEDPVNWVPDYFLSPGVLQNSIPRGDLNSGNSNDDTIAPPDGSATIFDQMAAINPQCFSDDGTMDGAVNISWLRKADEVIYERTWFKVTHTWIGSPIGHFDIQLFSQGNRPSQPSDYLPLS